LEGVCNKEIRTIMQAEETVLDRTEIRKLRWFGHLMRIPEERWPAKIHSWIPVGKKKRGQPRHSWRDGVTEAMEEGRWGKKMPRTGYFGEENWEGGGLLYKPIYIYTPPQFVTHNFVFPLAQWF
jgi:hypothetical protein